MIVGMRGRFTIAGGRLVEVRAAAPTIERRTYVTEFREVPGSNGRQKWATAVTYDQVDDWGTIWSPGVFAAALGERMPVVLYGHDWYSLEHVLGRGVDANDVRKADQFGPPRQDVLIQFDDPDFVPMVRQVIHQTTRDAQGKATLEDVSVGFSREEWIRHDDLSPKDLAAGADERMDLAGMDELSIVVRGAVPGAQLRARRRGGRTTVTVSEDLAVSLAKRVVAGELTQEEAAIALRLAAEETGEGDEGTGDGKTPEELAAEAAAIETAATAAATALSEAETESDAALALLDGKA